MGVIHYLSFNVRIIMWPFCMHIHTGEGSYPKNFCIVGKELDSGELSGLAQSLARNGHPSLCDHARLCFTGNIERESNCLTVQWSSVLDYTGSPCNAASTPICSDEIIVFRGNIKTMHSLGRILCTDLFLLVINIQLIVSALYDPHTSDDQRPTARFVHFSLNATPVYGRGS